MENQGRWVDLTQLKTATYEDHTVVIKQRAPEYCDDYLTTAVQFLRASAHSGDIFFYEKQGVPASPVSYNGHSLAWIAQNQEQLYRDYPNEWILVSNQSVLAHSRSAADIEMAAQEYGITNAFVTKAVKPTKPVRTIYVFG